MPKSRPLIFIPTYNERENAVEMCKQILALSLDADILFMDDNSPDGTGDLLDQFAASHREVSVVHRSGKLGIGSAHRDGIRWAYDHDYETLVTMDCDFTHSPLDIPRFLAQLSGCDVVVGSRYLQEDSLPNWNLLRKSLTMLGHIMTRHLLQIKHDATGAFRIYKLSRIPRELFERVQSRGYAFFFESLFLLTINGFTIHEVPIVLPARTYGSSKMSVREAARSAIHLLTLWKKSKVNPAQFQLGKPPVTIDKALVDPQNWDHYWNEKKSAGNAAYDMVAWTYRNLMIKRRLNCTIFKHFRAGSLLLHAGCGSGQVDVDIQNHVRITAIDISPSALGLYQNNVRRSHAIRHASIFNIPFADNSFDGVYNLGVMEHFNDVEIRNILGEFNRVLRADGKLVLFWPHIRASSVMVLKSVHWFLNSLLKKDMHLHPPEISLLRSKTQIESRLNEASFELIDYYFGARDLFVQAIIVAGKKQGE